MLIMLPARLRSSRLHRYISLADSLMLSNKESLLSLCSSLLSILSHFTSTDFIECNRWRYLYFELIKKGLYVDMDTHNPLKMLYQPLFGCLLALLLTCHINKVGIHACRYSFNVNGELEVCHKSCGLHVE